MAEFLIRGKDLQGRKTSRLIDAGSAEEAIRIVDIEGWREVRLMSDDINGTLADWHSGALTPDEQWDHCRGSFVGFVAWSLWRVFSRSPVPWITLVCVIVRRTLDIKWSVVDTGLVIASACFLVAVSMPILNGGARAYDRLIRDLTWGRWDKVLDGLEQGVEWLARHEQLRLRACALAGLGRVNEALQEFDVLADGLEIPRWLYFSLRSGIHFNANDRAAAIDDMRCAYQEAPDNPTVLLGYAESLMNYGGDKALARRVFAEAHRRPIAESIQWIVPMIDAMFAIDELRYDDAHEDINRSLSLAGPMVHSVGFLGMRARFHALQSLAEEGRGNHRSALRHYNRAEPLLRTRPADPWLGECRRALKL